MLDFPGSICYYSGMKRKSQIRKWLDEQPRSALTYDAKVADKSGRGWTVDELVKEAWIRGVDLRTGSVNNWIAGTKPGPLAVHAVRGIFPNIKF